MNHESKIKQNKISCWSILQILAYLTMLIDHIAASYEFKGYYDGQPLYEIMRGIGRIAFPLFLIFLVNGFQRTSNKSKYFIRIFIFAIISEVPFDLCMFNKLNWGHQNVGFELIVCFLALLLTEKFIITDRKFLITNICFVVGISLLFGIIAIFGNFDYQYIGIPIVLILYFCIKKWNIPIWIQYTIAIALLCLFDKSEIAGIIAIPIIFFIEKFFKGDNALVKNKQISKIIRYGFYPVHLIVIWIITTFLI